MKRIFFLIGLLGLVVAALVIFRDHPRVSAILASNPLASPKPASRPAALPPLPPPALPPPLGVKPELVRFLSRESVSLDSTHVNAEEAERRSLEQAEAMGPLEIAYARDTVLSGKGSANERILALYLLTLVGPKAAGALREIALTPLPDARVEPHTEAEHKLMEAKAQSVTAIDALIEQWKGSPTIRDDLRRLADEMRDSGLKNYILRKLEQLSR